MTVDDPNLVLNAVGSPTDANANGGGITLNSSSGNKQLYWNNADKRWYFDNGTGGQVNGAMKMVVDLTDIRSVETTAFNKGHMFFYDGTNWVNGNNIKFADIDDRPTITTEINVNNNNQTNSGGINSTLRLVKDTTTAAYTNGAGTGLLMSVVSGQTGQTAVKDLIRITGSYSSQSDHDVALQATTTDNSTLTDLIRSNRKRTNINNGKLFVDVDNGRVGINTVAPNTTLDVQGNAYISSTLEVNSSMSAATTITAGSNIFGGGELYLAGSTVVLKNGFTGAPNTDAGFLVERGNETDAYWKWIENGDYWNTNHSIIANGEIVAVGVLATNGHLIIFNNDNTTPAGTDHALLRVKRGGNGSTDVFFRWNETTDRWDFTNNGSTYTNIPVATDTPTYVGLNTTTGNVNVNNKTILYGDTGDVKVGGDIYADGNNLTFNYAQTGSPDK
jgi:hypothetical protein